MLPYNKHKFGCTCFHWRCLSRLAHVNPTVTTCEVVLHLTPPERRDHRATMTGTRYLTGSHGISTSQRACRSRRCARPMFAGTWSQ